LLKTKKLHRRRIRQRRGAADCGERNEAAGVIAPLGSSPRAEVNALLGPNMAGDPSPALRQRASVRLLTPMWAAASCGLRLGPGAVAPCTVVLHCCLSFSPRSLAGRFPEVSFQRGIRGVNRLAECRSRITDRNGIRYDRARQQGTCGDNMRPILPWSYRTSFRVRLSGEKCR
jgi:hypothetical protein